MTLALVLAFTALAGLAVLALLWSRWPAWLKGLLVVGVTALYFFGNEQVHQMWGWPTTDALPSRFVLLAVVIEEPTPKTRGALYVWAQPIDNGAPVAAPRNYRLPYAKDLHALFDEGMKKARQGVTQMGSAEPKRGGRGFFAWLKPGSDEQTIKLRDMPLPQLPEK
jgi:hypothetical protein